MEGGFPSNYNFKSNRGKVVCVTHFLFADDMLIFYKDSREEMTYLSWTIMRFEAPSGSRLNLENSFIHTVGKVENTKGVLPSTYLGLPLSASHKLEIAWDVVENIIFCLIYNPTLVKSWICFHP